MFGAQNNLIAIDKIAVKITSEIQHALLLLPENEQAMLNEYILKSAEELVTMLAQNEDKMTVEEIKDFIRSGLDSIKRDCLNLVAEIEMTLKTDLMPQLEAVSEQVDPVYTMVKINRAATRKNIWQEVHEQLKNFHPLSETMVSQIKDFILREETRAYESTTCFIPSVRTTRQRKYITEMYKTKLELYNDEIENFQTMLVNQAKKNLIQIVGGTPEKNSKLDFHAKIALTQAEILKVLRQHASSSPTSPKSSPKPSPKPSPGTPPVLRKRKFSLLTPSPVASPSPSPSKPKQTNEKNDFTVPASLAEKPQNSRRRLF